MKCNGFGRIFCWSGLEDHTRNISQWNIVNCSIGQVSRVPSHDGELSFNCACMFNAFLVYFLKKSVTAFDICRPYGVLMVCVCVCVRARARARVCVRETDRQIERRGERAFTNFRFMSDFIEMSVQKINAHL